MAFLADLVASYLFKVTNNKFKEVLWRGIYRDDGLLMLKGRISISEIRIWRDNPKRRLTKLKDMITYISLVKLGTQVEFHPKTRQKLHQWLWIKTFPFLDLELFWGNSGILKF